MNPFYKQVYEVVRQIPSGKVVSYGQIAWFLGYPRAARQVGRAMRSCKEDLPCHRVVMFDGSITGGPFADLRKEALIHEGLVFLPDGRVDMDECQWDMQDLADGDENA